MAQSGISYVDVAICFVLVVFVFIGYRRGFTEEFLKISGTIIAFLVATRYMSYLSPVFTNSLGLDASVGIIFSFILIFLAIVVLFKMLRQKTRKAFTFSVGLGGADKLVGGALGMFKGALIVSLLAMLLGLWGPPQEFRDHIYSSKLYNPMLKIAPAVYNVVKRFIPNSNPFEVELQNNVNKVNSYERADKAQEFIYELQDNN